MGEGTSEADLIVIGGGPAGSATAIMAARRGLRVILFERDGRFVDRPGETLHPGIVPLLRQLGVAERLPPLMHAHHAGLCIAWGGPARFVPFGSDAAGPWQGFHVWRPDFDEWLLAEAQGVGVSVRRPVAVLGVTVEDGVIRGVVTADGAMRARSVVDASGRARWLGRQLSIASPACSPVFIARYGYVEGACPPRDDTPLLSGDASGWTWTARIRERTYQWTRLSFGAPPDADWIPEELQHLAPLTRARGMDVTWRCATQTAGLGWFMAGDAAATLDPTSSRGVLKAIMSGIAAGTLAAEISASRLPAQESASSYHDWLQGWFSHDVGQLVALYRKLDADLFVP